MCYHTFKGKDGNKLRYRALCRDSLWSTGSRRLASRVVDQSLAERPDRAGDLVAGGDDGIERGFDPAAVFFGDRQRRQQLDGVAAVAGDLREDLVILEQRHRDELAEQTLVGGLEQVPRRLQPH